MRWLVYTENLNDELNQIKKDGKLSIDITNNKADLARSDIIIFHEYYDDKRFELKYKSHLNKIKKEQKAFYIITSHKSIPITNVKNCEFIVIDKKPDAELLSKIIEKANVKPPYVIEFGIGIGIGLVIGIGIGIFIYRNEKKK